jgi:CheY-like chemotaxis protein
MNRRPGRSIIDEDLAEGLRETREPEGLRSGIRQMSAMPPLAPRDMPSGQTGMLPALKVNPEGSGRDDAQDASLTTAESAIPTVQFQRRPVEGRAPSVLIVEDARELAELLQITLERGQLECAIESRGHTALARFRDMQPDVVLLDIGLPDMTGWKVLEGIKDSARLTGFMPAVIIITAYGDSSNRLLAKAQNVHSYLVKPFTSAEVLRVVQQALSGHAA